jgi:hypothetical protein
MGEEVAEYQALASKPGFASAFGPRRIIDTHRENDLLLRRRSGNGRPATNIEFRRSVFRSSF